MSESNDFLSEEEYEVERIVDHRKHAGKLQYLIKWKYYTDDDNTWESESNVFAVDLVRAYWADRGGNDALIAARKGKQFKRRKSQKDKEKKSSKSPTKRTSPESSSTRDESAKRQRIESDTAATQEAIAESPSSQPQQRAAVPTEAIHFPLDSKSLTETETTTTVHKTPPPATDEQSRPPKEVTPGENTVEAATTTSADIVAENLRINDDLRAEKETVAESSSPEKPLFLQDSMLDEESTLPWDSPIYEEPSVPEELVAAENPVASEEPPVSEEPSVSEERPVSESRTSEEPPALDMSPVLEKSPAVGEPPAVKIPPVHEAQSDTSEPPPTTEGEESTGLQDVDQEMPERSGGTDIIADHDTSINAAIVEPESMATNKGADIPITESSGIADGEANDDALFGMISDMDEPTAALDEDQILDIMGDDDMTIQQATVLNEQEVQRAMHGSIKSMFKPTEKNLKPISEINSEDVIYDENFPADPADWVNVKEVVAVTQVPHDTPDRETFVVVRWENDVLSMHPSEEIRTHCPHQLINFYEKSLKFVV